jgi:hypothetical protein
MTAQDERGLGWGHSCLVRGRARGAAQGVDQVHGGRERPGVGVADGQVGLKGVSGRLVTAEQFPGVGIVASDYVDGDVNQMCRLGVDP